MKITRRTFVTTSAAGGTALAATTFFIRNAGAVNDELHPDPAYGDAKVKTVRTACMMCNAGCGLQVRVKNGVALKIEGNPFCVHTNDYTTGGTLTEAAHVPDSTNHPGRICARGNGGLGTVYNPYRLTTPLKRVGPRGSGNWETISWKDLVEELANGATLSNAFGTGSYAFDGLAKVRGDAAPLGAAAGKLGASDTAYGNEAKGGDPANFGKKANQYVWIRGRDQIAQITKRFNESYGTVNHVEHSSLCNTTWATAMKHTFFGWSAGKYAYHRADLDNVNYLILMGTNPLEANVGTPYWARKLLDLKAKGGKLIVVDPYFTHTAARADQWIPIKPGTDLALVFGMLRHLVDQNKIDHEYLKITHAGVQGAGKNFTAASYLVWGEVVGNEVHREGYLTDKKAGLTPLTKLYADITDKTATTIAVADASKLPAKGVVMIDSEIVYFDAKADKVGYWELTGCKRAIDTSAATHKKDTDIVCPYTVMDGVTVKRYFEPTAIADIDLEFQGQLNGVEVSTAWAILEEETAARTVEEWAALCDVDAATVKQLATDFVAAGNKSALEAYRGAWSHTNGIHTAVLVNLFNAVTGRVDRVGGYLTSKRFGAKEPGRALKTKGDGSVSLTSGVRIDRAGGKYEGTAAKPSRMWYPIAGVVSQEAIVSAAQGYPYKTRFLALYCYNPAYTTPNSGPTVAALTKHDASGVYAIPAVYSCSLFMDETAALCDYVLPDSSYLERFTWPFTGYPTVKTKAATIRRPVIGKYKDVTIEGRAARIYVPHNATLEGTSFGSADDLLAGWSGPMPYDELLIQLAKKLQLPNFGVDATGKAGQHIDTAWQFWDLAAKAGDFPAGLDNEGKDGSPGSFDTAGGPMELGGKWEDPGQVEDPAAPGWAKNRYGACIYLFREKPVHYKNPFTGKAYHGIPTWEEPGEGLKGNHSDYAGSPGHDLILNTGKRAWQTQSRTTNNEWLLELQKENFLSVSSEDAAALYVETGDRVKVSSLTNTAGVIARVKVVEDVRPGTIHLYHHFGRKWFGAEPVYVNGTATDFDKRVGAGTAANPVIEGDPDFPDVPFTEQQSGGACYFYSHVKIQKI